ncbi:MAG: hypothetical protein ACR2OM_02695, partial [Aestuariivirgaceae bacterium]
LKPAASEQDMAAPGEQPAAPCAPRIHTAAASQMPNPEDFPPIAQKQIAEHNEPALASNEPVQKKQRKSLLERLASVGLGSKREDDEVVHTPENEPRIVEQSAQGEAETQVEEQPVAEQPAAEQPGVAETASEPADDGDDNVHQLAPQIDPTLDDDDLEIPAFLRRQAN